MNVDLQIINFRPNCKDEWFEAAKNSVKDEPVNLHLYQGNRFGPLHLRQEFIEQSETPYLGWIDDDDEIIPGTVQQCVDFLDREENQHYCGVYTNFSIMDENSVIIEEINQPDYEEVNIFTIRKRPFHFILLRREAARYSLKIPAKYHGAIGGDTLLIVSYATLFGDWFRLPIQGYKWRSREGSNGKKINEYGMVISHCNKVVKHKELFRS